jgi:hypothetical protein
MSAFDHALVAHDRRGFDHIPELADVSRPAVRDQRVARFITQTGRRAARHLGEALTAGANSGWGGFLGNAATTAAGVAGGAFLVQGLEGLFGHHPGGFLGESAPAETVENVTVNDYSGDTESSGSASADDSDGLDDDDFNDDSSWT